MIDPDEMSLYIYINIEFIVSALSYKHFVVAQQCSHGTSAKIVPVSSTHTQRGIQILNLVKREHCFWISTQYQQTRSVEKKSNRCIPPQTSTVVHVKWVPCSFITTNAVVYFESILHSQSCFPKYSIAHQMWTVENSFGT